MKRYAVGLMSGTSLDGVDAALIEADGSGGSLRARVLGHVEAELGPVEAVLRAAAEGEALPAVAFLRAGRRLGERYAEVAADCVHRFLPPGATLTLAATHGQTVCHAPAEGLSWQLLDPQPLAERLGVEVVGDLRQGDLAAGGQGAPITPLADLALYARGTLVVNLGGVVNATWLPGTDAPPEGGDVCVCNLLLDGIVSRLHPGERFDDGGRRAAAGRADEAAVQRLRGGPGFAAAPGATLGREQVPPAWLEGLVELGLAPDDLLASAVAAVARGVAGAADRWPADRVVLAGGGVRNAALVAAIRDASGGRAVLLSEEAGVASQAREAAAMAVLGLRAADGAALTVEAVTGARRPATGGRWCRPAEPRTAEEKPRQRPRSADPPAPAGASPPEGFPPSEGFLAGADRLDAMGTPELLSFLHARDAEAVAAVTACLPALAGLVDAAVAAHAAGGRVFYVGAGTSGRLGVLDASELPPTFSAGHGEVLAFIAGGDAALRSSAEGAEDDPAGADAWLDEHAAGAGDVVLGIAASGTTPLVWGALDHARAAGATTALLACVPPNRLPPRPRPEHLLLADTGAEAVGGSTRMKAGTATKLLLNLLSTALMVRRGRVWGGWMVDLKASNAKLRVRAERILREAGGVPAAEAGPLLDAAAGSARVALVMRKLSLSRQEAEARLASGVAGLRPLLGPPPPRGRSAAAG
ncbi:anhydro-N-acetylmuramic acid kinase [Phycisphaera mikurensis]|uniref:Anhydro-N-acetylmuramic acid kinase/N-acetylmuramic acid 6-phosphate etherase n=1 Tax=Phycisphaera mikurensis (strain NBRC 102666 / KCTC 22515 / FYK2301M01) TaxID=1142394 RepID=I0IGW1_PHYMF|nr:anhydro-N-acetylmuramic acid kinase [Phycisphaera mikurensis]MBB6440756.1 N-acetylmuramic acid 6-phosphate etherase [Phycisphaera mikurensis]BAM04499.1 anhydro-N-acetylmuramic acid kinase/N-acetylmuramic acid 6-phosphate etherase [Phycisphaera mikurensis NBRC 102666]